MADHGPRQLPDQPIYGLSADQVLQSPYFNLDSTRPPEVVVELPKLLRAVVFEDWKRIVGLGCLVSLPRRPSVADIVRCNVYRYSIQISVAIIPR